MKPYVLFAIFVGLTVLFFAAFLLFCGANFKKKNNRRVDFLVDFPFEAMEGDGPLMALSRTLLALFETASVAGSIYLIYLFPSFDYMIGIVVIYGAACLLKAGACLTMSFIPAYYFRQHLFAFMSYLLLFAFAEIMSMICFLNLQGFSTPLSLTFMIISGVLALAAIIAAFNPRLTNWTKLKSTMEKDGTIVTERPRPFPLAATEWVMFWFDLFGCLASIFGFFLIAIL
ncbi:MAG: hypothetical protein K6F32_05015 [Bacilli bacterium]|nr:hypothetical protein [Bacilli bacterium]